jgi:hypothetical protein
MASMTDKMPVLLLVAETDPAAARRGCRLATGGHAEAIVPDQLHVQR